MKTPDNPARARRVTAPGTPQPAQIQNSAEEPRTASLTDWRTEYGGTLNPETGKVELPTPAYAPCPYENCPDCKTERGE